MPGGPDLQIDALFTQILAIVLGELCDRWKCVKVLWLCLLRANQTAR